MLCRVSRADPGWDWYRALKLLCKEMVGMLLGMLLALQGWERCGAGAGDAGALHGSVCAQPVLLARLEEAALRQAAGFMSFPPTQDSPGQALTLFP